MIVLVVKIAFFIMGHALIELMLSDKLGVNKKVEVVVDGGTAYPKVFGPHFKV